MIARRSFIFASFAAALPVPALADPLTAPSQADLERYYAFLWCELGELSKEMGVEMLSYGVLHDAGGHKAYLAQHGHAAPSMRAISILLAADLSANRVA